MLENYKIENFEIMNMEKDGDKFIIENILTEDEKRQFVDSQCDGIASYLLDLTQKYIIDKENLPKDSYGDVKTMSLKAWLNRNDTRKIVDKEYKYGEYYVFGNNYYNIKYNTVSGGRYSHYALYKDGSLVNQWFHDLLSELYEDEVKYFKKHDSRGIKLEIVKKLGRKYGSFNSVILSKLCGMGFEDINKSITEEKLNYYISLYERMELLSKEIIKELKESGEELFTED